MGRRQCLPAAQRHQQTSTHPQTCCSLLLFVWPGASPIRRPNATWSPGQGGAGEAPSARALKRAENWLGSIVVPLSQLGEGVPDEAPLYATQMSTIKDSSSLAYYYRTPANSAWLKVDLAALADATERLWFPVGAAAPPRAFADDVTGSGGAAAA